MTTRRFAFYAVLAFAATACSSTIGGVPPQPQTSAVPGSITGTVESGTHAIADSVVTLYRAGNRPGGGAVQVAHATSDASGRFAIPYQSAFGAAPLYVVATGGNAGSGNNSAIGLVGLAGSSSRPLSIIVVNELSTVSVEFALAQFADSSGKIVGALPTNGVGLANAVALAQTNLVSPQTGTPASFWPPAAECAGLDGPPNCEGLQLLDSLANTLAACVDSSSAKAAACSQLFALTSSHGTTAAAIHAIALDPSNSAAALFQQSQASHAYAPARDRAPDAWTLALQYVGNGKEFDGPGNLAIDALGNLWISNNYEFNADPRVPVCGGKLLPELTPLGADAPGAPFTGGGVSGQGFGVVLDLKGNVWSGNFGFAGKGCTVPPVTNSVSEFASDGQPISPAKGFTQGSIVWPQGMAVDLTGNIWITNFKSPLTVTEYRNADPSDAVVYSTGGLRNPFTMSVDASNRIWITNFKGDSVTVLDQNGKPQLGSPLTNVGIERPLGDAIDSRGNVWISNNGGDSMTLVDSNGKAAPGSPFTGGGVRLPWGDAIDGNDNVWISDFSGKDPRLSELCGARNVCPRGLRTGAPITPSTGYTSRLLTRLTGVAIDRSGDVWVPDNWNQIPLQTNPGGHAMVEFVGLAGPVKTPMLGPVRRP
jgi:hypothetical protein